MPYPPERGEREYINIWSEYEMRTIYAIKLFRKSAQGNEMKKNRDCAGTEITVCIIMSVITLSGGCVWTFKILQP